MSDQPPITLDDGLLHFTILNKETGEVVKHAIDVMDIRIASQECVDLHNLQVNENQSYIISSAFMADLKARIVGLGVTDCTTSIAYQLWGESVSGIETLKKNTNQTPNLPSGSESNLPEPTNESAVSNSPPPEASPPTNESGSGPT